MLSQKNDFVSAHSLPVPGFPVSAPTKTIQGFSLIELMISLVLGLIVIGGVISIFSTTAASSAIALKTVRLDQQLRATMDIMTRDIRRAGYRNNSVIPAVGATPAAFNATDNPFITSPNQLSLGTVTLANDCIAFTYDSSTTGVSGLIDDVDKFGFRRELSGTIGLVRMRNPGSAGAVDCAFTARSITEEKSVDITALNFTATPACPYSTTLPEVIQILPATTPPTYRIIRTIRITLSGRLVNDATVPVRTLTDTVRIQNDRVITNLALC